ncbi:outer membrane beta-barrel protein [Francisella frigiditurris]|uniref:OmpA-like transmembrane domain protein n=1 Tax=Francisella frigiditurris TaxID=1542390 RepID=A0A1J0KTB4_9GAMM|nr:outer membrane beta-barrel protein [Francisella frigiditurris]APC96931.1 ompA-like transmembrane domain protein [Francisella frigiditurris]
MFYKHYKFFFILLLLIPSICFSSETLKQEDVLDQSEYYNVYNFDNMNTKDFEPAPFIGISGGWGQATSSPAGGVIFATAGYRFTESFAAEFGYSGIISNAYSTTQVNNNYMGILKYHYKINDYLELGAGVGAGLSHNSIQNIENAKGAPSSYLESNNTQTGFVVFPFSIGTPIKFIDNLSLGVNYIYARTFNGVSVNIVTTGLIYSFL